MIRKLLRVLYHKSKIKEANKRYSFIQNFNSRKIISQNISKKSFYHIAFLLPGLPAYSGGITGIFRLATYLSTFGHKITYIDCSNSPVTTSKRNAKINFDSYKGDIVTLESVRGTFDIGICTLWDTAYLLHQNDKIFDYKMYFIQDFEPSFYPLGDLHFMCRRTYKFGFHMISLGIWNALKIRENFSDVNVDSIEFPVELNIYKVSTRQNEITTRLDLAIFIKLEPKRAPDLIPQCLILLNSEMKKRGIDLHCWIFGTEIPFELPFAKSLGMLRHDDLQKLYKRCHFGMVASFTNISYVTFEMMASGLPVIEFAEGSASSFFNLNEIILVNSDPKDFSSRINYYIDHPTELNSIVSHAQETIKQRTWEGSAKNFNEIINGLKTMTH